MEAKWGSCEVLASRILWEQPSPDMGSSLN